MLTCLLKLICVFVLLSFALSEDVSISRKGSKYAVLNQINVTNIESTSSESPHLSTTTPSTTTTEDPFFSDDFDDDLFADFDESFDGMHAFLLQSPNQTHMNYILHTEMHIIYVYYNISLNVLNIICL